MKDLKDVMALMRQQNSRLDRLRMGANWRGNIIQRAVQNVKTYFIDFMDENTNVDDDDYNFYPLEKEINLGKIKDERVLVLAKVERPVRGRIPVTFCFEKIQVEN